MGKDWTLGDEATKQPQPTSHLLLVLEVSEDGWAGQLPREWPPFVHDPTFDSNI